MTFELLPVDGLEDDQLKEMANLFAAKCQKAAQQTVKDAIVAGNALNELKRRAKHGEWRAWLKENFDYSTVTAFTYMTLAANVKRLTFEPTSIRAALKAIAEETTEESDERPVTPRAERVTGRVSVSKPEPEQPFGTSEELTADENAVPAEPKTNRLHKPEARKAREADRPTPAVVTPEIVEEPTSKKTVHEMLAEESAEVRLKFAIREVSQVLTQIAVESERKSAAKQLRKLADELDPPVSGKTPSRAELVAMIPDDWAPELRKAAADWAEYKQARAKGERIQTIRAWELALEKFTSQSSKTVIAKVNKAIENSWKGWDHDSGKTANAKPKPRDRDMSTYYQ